LTFVAVSGAGAVVGSAPRELKLTFSEGLEARLSGVADASDSVMSRRARQAV